MRHAEPVICHRCGHRPPPDGDERSHCPNDGLTLIPVSEHERHPRDMVLGTKVGGKYAVVGVLGHGGMGTVYRSIQPLVEREVAVKLVLPANESVKEAVAERFLREAKAIARLTHPGIVTLHDFGVEPDGTAYMVMELVRGRTLSRAMRVGDMDGPRFTETCLEILEALGAAHSKGLVHRDLKPENIMVLDEPTGRNTIKVLDFGLAKLAASRHGGARLTKTGMVFGTPQYMSPEQARGDDADHRSDIYALGVVLYEGLAGQLPFDGEQPLAILQGHVSKPVPALPKHVTPELEGVVRRALSKEPGERFSSALDMAAALRDAAAASEGAVPDSHPTIAEGPRPVTRLGGPAPPISEPPEDELDSARTEVMAERPNGDAPSLLSIGDASGELTALQPPPADRRLVLALGGAAVGVLALGILLWGGGKAEDAAPPRRAPAVASPEPAPQPTTRVKVTSEPLGAEVLLGDRLVGATPIVLTPEGSMGEQVVYRVRTWGHLEDALRIHIDGGEQAAHVKLIPIPPKPRPKRKRARPAAESPAVFSPFPAPPAAVPAPPAAPPKLDLPRRSLP